MSQIVLLDGPVVVGGGGIGSEGTCMPEVQVVVAAWWG